MRRVAWSLALAASLLCGTASAEGKVWAVVVGIDEYVRPSIPKLRYAVADAKLFARAIQDGLKVSPDHLFLMTSDAVDENLQPRLTNLAYRLGWLKDHVKKDDTVIFYFAGHGLTVEGQPFLLTEEADNRSATTLRLSALNGGDLIGLLRQSRSANVWVVLDACRNSPGSKAESQLEAGLTGAFSQADVGLERSATMFACNLGERSWELDEVKHGCYTYYLVDGLRLQAADAVGRVTLQSLFDYAAREVKAATSRRGTPQNPRLFYGGPSSNEWVLAQVKPRPAVAQSNADYVAQLELLQARLDRESALRVAAEKRADLEESRRRELEQRVALMEKQLHATSGLSPSQSTPHSLAYADRGLENLPREQALAEEIARLKEENRHLQQRLTELQGSLAKLGMVSREVSLLEQEQAIETKLQAQAGPNLEQQLQSCLEVRESQHRRLQILESACGEALARKELPRPVALEADALKAKIELQRSATLTFEQAYKACRLSLQEADARLLEAEARSRRDAQKIAELGQSLARAQEERDEARRRLEEQRQQLEVLKAQIARRFRHSWEEKRDFWNVRGARLLIDVLDVMPAEAQDFNTPPSRERKEISPTPPTP